MIIVGIILLLVGYLVSLPVPFDQIAIFVGWILVVVGVILAILGGTGRAVAGRRYWY
jgi:protein-S-isoprenylcysteine O-methyltransferase Ste14